MARSRLENPLPDILEATDAVTRIISLKRDVFLLNQELKTLRQFKRTILYGTSVLFFNLLLLFTFYWLGVGLHEDGWSAFSLAILSFAFFSLCIALLLTAARYVGPKPKKKV